MPTTLSDQDVACSSGSVVLDKKKKPTWYSKSACIANVVILMVLV
jgi:hypothetical protein